MNTVVFQYDYRTVPMEVVARKDWEGQFLDKTVKTSEQGTFDGMITTGSYTLDQG